MLIPPEARQSARRRHGSAGFHEAGRCGWSGRGHGGPVWCCEVVGPADGRSGKCGPRVPLGQVCTPSRSPPPNGSTAATDASTNTPAICCPPSSRPSATPNNNPGPQAEECQTIRPPGSSNSPPFGNAANFGSPRAVGSHLEQSSSTAKHPHITSLTTVHPRGGRAP